MTKVDFRMTKVDFCMTKVDFCIRKVYSSDRRYKYEVQYIIYSNKNTRGNNFLAVESMDQITSVVLL